MTGFLDFEQLQNGCIWPHKRDAETVWLMGESPLAYDGVRFTVDQHKNLHRWNCTDAPSSNKLELNGARNDLSMSRRAAQNGLRVMAILASYLEPGDDPVEVVLQMMRDLGWDVPYMVEEFSDDQD